MNQAAISLKLMQSAAKKKAQGIVRQRVANKKAATAARPSPMYTREERLDLIESAYEEYLESWSLNDFYPEAWWTFLCVGIPAGNRRML